jgi:hypothetical protein
LRAFNRTAMAELLRIGGVFQLIVGIVELLLVHVEPNQWPLRTRGHIIHKDSPTSSARESI